MYTIPTLSRQYGVHNTNSIGAVRCTQYQRFRDSKVCAIPKYRIHVQVLWTVDSSRSRSRSSRARARAKEGRLELVHFTDLEQVDCVRSDHSYVFNTSLSTSLTSSRWTVSFLTTATAPGLACLCPQHEFVHYTDLEQGDCSDHSHTCL